MMRHIVFVLLFFCWGAAQAQQTIETLPDTSLISPRSCINNHYYFLQEQHFDKSKSVRSLFPVQGMSEKKLERRALQLKQIYDGVGFYNSVKDIPGQADYIDSLSNEHIYRISKNFPKLYLEKIEGKWYYSKESVLAIPVIHQRVYPYGMDKLLNMLQGLGDNQFLGIYYWQVLGLLIILGICVIVYQVLTHIASNLLERVLLRLKLNKTHGLIIKPLSKPFSLFVVISLAILMLPILQFTAKFQAAFLLILRLLQPFFLLVLIYRLVDIICDYFAKVARTTESTLDDQLVPLLRRFLKVVVVIIGMLLVLQNLDYDITTLLAGISIGGLAFALAAQDTIKNLFGSLMIFVDRPFQIGDWVTGSGFDGTVEEVGFRSTRIRTFHNSVTSIPNGKIADMTVDNMGLRSYRRYKTMIQVTYDTPASAVELFVEGLREIVRQHPETRKDYFHVYFNSYGAHSLDILFYIFFSVPEWGDELRARHEVNLEIMKLAEHLGVRFAFPTQTLHMEEFPGQPSMTPGAMDRQEMEMRMASYFETKK